MKQQNSDRHFIQEMTGQTDEEVAVGTANQSEDRAGVEVDGEVGIGGLSDLRDETVGIVMTVAVVIAEIAITNHEIDPNPRIDDEVAETAAIATIERNGKGKLLAVANG